MSIYIISNRHVIEKDGKEQFSDKRKQKALKEFRVARVINETEDVSKISYEILSDYTLAGYREVSKKIKDGEDINSIGGTATMFADLYKQMIKSNKREDCLFFIHGFNNSEDYNKEHIKKMYELYIEPENSGINHMVYVMWPTVGHLFGTYWNDQCDAETTGLALKSLFTKLYVFFVDLFEKLGQERCSNRIHMMVHSMGNQVLEYMLRGIPPQRQIQIFDEVLLLNSDVKYDVFEPREPFSYLEKMSNRTHIYINNSDNALDISRFTKNFNKRLGKKGPKSYENLSDETFVIDTTHTNDNVNHTLEKKIDHWGYLYRNEVIHDIKAVMRGENEEKIKMRKKSKQKKNLYILKSK